MTTVSALLIALMSATLILLAVESNSFLQVPGYGFGILLLVALVVNWGNANKRDRAS